MGVGSIDIEVTLVNCSLRPVNIVMNENDVGDVYVSVQSM